MTVQQLVYQALNIGEKMLTCGAEVRRVEDTVERICRAYDMARVDVFTITSSITLTVQAKNGTIETQTRRIKSYATNLDELSALNGLSRYICANRPEAEEIETLFAQAIEEEKELGPHAYAVYAGVAFSFTLFFGGNFRDAAAAAPVGILLGYLIRVNGRLRMNHVMFNILSSAAGGFLTVFLVAMGIGVHADKIMIGNIMLLIPGLAMTNSIRDLLSGDTMSGILRLCDAMIVAVAIAVGFSIPLMLTGGVFG